jgi:hypothetical protein
MLPNSAAATLQEFQGAAAEGRAQLGLNFPTAAMPALAAG